MYRWNNVTREKERFDIESDYDFWSASVLQISDNGQTLACAGSLGNFYLMDLSNMKLRKYRIPDRLRDYYFDFNKSILYMINRVSDFLIVYDLLEGTVIKKIPVGNEPVSIITLNNRVVNSYTNSQCRN